MVPPDAVRAMVAPEQMVELAVAVTVGVELTVIVTEPETADGQEPFCTSA